MWDVKGRRTLQTHEAGKTLLKYVVKTKVHRQAARQSRTGNGNKQNAKQLTDRLLSPQHGQRRGEQQEEEQVCECLKE